MVKLNCKKQAKQTPRNTPTPRLWDLLSRKVISRPDENQSLLVGTKPGEIREGCESSGAQRRNSTDANCGDFVDPKVSSEL